MKYGAILADPPWHWKAWSKSGTGRSPENHYSVMDLDALSRLQKPMECAADDCVLFLWATMPMLPEALWLMARWQFKYKTVGFVWVKLNKGSTTPFKGLGYWTRANAEIVLLGTKGNPQRLDKSVSQIMMVPRREHSRKPDEIYGRIERLVKGPYLEMFARQKWPGWDAWGDEVDKFQPG